ncbi:MAG: redoxin family protein [Planctomycetota bacterium]|nr:redoxin family protein [Planctomycetota bacterium]
MKTTVVDVAQQPIPRATVRLAATPLRDWDKVSTDELGVAKSAKAPADNVALHISAEGFRPASWILGEGGNELRVILAPVWRGVVVDRGKPVSDAWVTNASLQFRADGLPYVPQPGWDGRDQDWSGADGQFAMKSSLTLRRFDTVLPLFTIDPKQKKMAIRFESADTTKEALELNLESTCLVRGECLLEGVSESADVAIAVESAKRQPIGFLTTRRQLVAGGQRVDFQLSLPPGEYVLTARKSSQHAGFEIPFSIPSGKSALDLGTTVVAPSEAVALKGKPAPELQLRWRPGEEKNWEQLRGKVVVLDFWGTWCVPCVNDMPLLMELADKFRDQPVEWLSVHTPELKTFEELDRALAVCQEKSWNRKPLPFTTVLDSPVPESKYSGQTSERFGVVEWPTLIVVDRKGVVVGPVSRKNLAGTISRLLEDRAGE